jgi:hypothetical protein
VANKLYFTSAGLPSGLTTTTTRGTWTASMTMSNGASSTVRMWNTPRPDSGYTASNQSSASYTVSTTTTSQAIRAQTLYSPSVAAGGTLTGTVTITQLFGATGTTGLWFPKVHVYVINNTGTTVRGTLVDNWVGTSGNTSTSLRPYSFTISLTDVTLLAGDKVAIEVGWQSSGTTSVNGSALSYQTGGHPGPEQLSTDTNSTALTYSNQTAVFSDPNNVLGGISVTDTSSATSAAFFYMTVDPAAYTPATIHGTWNDSASTLTSQLALTGSGTRTAKAYTAPAAIAALNRTLLARLVSPPATVAGTTPTTAWFRGMVEAGNNVQSTTMFWSWYVYVTVGDSDTVRGVLLPHTDQNGGTANSGVYYVNTTARGTAVCNYSSAADYLASVNIQVGDRIVVELGVKNQTSSATLSAPTITYYGGGTAYPIRSNLSNNGPGWMEFGQLGQFFASTGSTLTASGTSDATATSSGSLSVDPSVSGTIAGTSTSSGAILLGIAASGTTAGVASSTGSAQLAGATSGSTAGTAATSGTVSAALAVFGTTAGTQPSTGSAALTKTASGVTAGAQASTADLTVSGAGGSSTTAMVGSSSGSLSAIVAVSGTTAGVSSSSGAQARSVAVSGSTGGLQATAGTPAMTLAVSGSTTAAGSTTGNVSSGSDMLGTTAGAQSSTGTASAARAASGVTAGTGGSAGALTAAASVAGTAAGVSSSSGSLVAARTVSGSSVGTGSSTGSEGLALSVSGATAAVAGSTGMVSSGSDQLGTTAGVAGSTGALGVERNLTGTTAMIGGTGSALIRVATVIGATAALAGNGAALAMVYSSAGITVAYQTATGTATLQTQLLATSDLVVTAWIKTVTGIDPTKVACTLPENVTDWGEVGFIQARTVGGSPDIYLPVQRPVVQVDVWAVKPNTGRPLWNVANVLAMRVLEATRDEANMRRELVLPTGYPRAHVLEAYPLTEPFRVESDPGGYARFRFDLQFHWVAVS